MLNKDINAKKFAKTALNENIEAFIIDIASFASKITIYLAGKFQILLLLTKKIAVPIKYTKFANIFSKKWAKILSKYIQINVNVIKLIDIK